MASEEARRPRCHRFSDLASIVAAPGNVGALAAIMNAVVDALAPLGIARTDMPAAPEQIWRAIRAAALHLPPNTCNPPP